MRHLTQIGDTIIEVLFAMAIMSLILGSTYSISSRSLLAGRQAQERGEALKFTETQAEKIKTLAVKNNGANYNQLQQGTIYCLDDTLTPKSIGLADIPPSSTPNFAPYETPGVGCYSGFYHYAIKYSSTQDVFTIDTQWDLAGGDGTGEVKLIYKVHE